jgi:hypothetical protein
MQHESRLGLTTMEVDHFNPTLSSNARNQYQNLFYSTRHCNNAKRRHWPTSGQQRKGIRFLNCCEEHDYGVHIFEDPKTHRVFGITPAGRYHVRICDLNAPHFVRERTDRAQLSDLLTNRNAIIRDLARGLELRNIVELLSNINSRMISPIEYRTPAI